MVNADLLRKTLEQIEKEPWRWDQKTWRRRKRSKAHPECKTAMCFAGWAVTLAGEEFLVPDKFVIRNHGGVEELLMPHDTSGGGSIRSRAIHVLGLTEDQAEELFDHMNTKKDLYEIVNYLIPQDTNDSESTT